MGVTPSAVQGFSMPDSQTTIAGIRSAINLLVGQIEKQVVMSFDTMSVLSSKVPAPTEGMVAWIKDVNTLLVYDSNSWVRIYPPNPRIYTGTTAPSSALGADGDFYFRR